LRRTWAKSVRPSNTRAFRLSALLYLVIYMKNWIKKKLGITQLENENKVLRSQLQSHREYVSEKIGELKEYTRVDADVGFRGNNTIVLTGVYRNKAFVRFYDLGDGEFKALVEQLKYMNDHALIRHLDAPPSFHGTFEI
jgi:hypothetical protein